MIDGIAGIILKLNPEFEDLETKVRVPGGGVRIKQYVRHIKVHNWYNVPKKKGDPSYKYLRPGQWLMLYDPYAIEGLVDGDPCEGAITVVGRVVRQEDHPDNRDFPCYNYFDPRTLWFPHRRAITLDDLEVLFDNFHRSRRYRNIAERQFIRLMRRAPAHLKP